MAAKIKLTPIGHRARLNWREYQKQLHLAVNTETRSQFNRWNALTGGMDLKGPATWKRTPARMAGNDLEGEVSALNEILSHLNYGSAGWIRFTPTRRPFRSGYRAGTRPGSLRGGRASRGGPWRSLRKNTIIQHKGFAGRQFDETMARERQPIFTKTVQSYLDRASIRAWQNK